MCANQAQVFIRCWNLNSCPHPCAASTLPTHNFFCFVLLFSINSCFLRSFIIGGSSMSCTDNSDNLSSLWIFIPLLIRPFALVKTWKKTSTFYYRILQNNYITLCKPSNITTNPSNVLPLSMILLLATHSGCRVLFLFWLTREEFSF